MPQTFDLPAVLEPLPPQISIDDALRRLRESDADALPITDEQGVVVALLTRPVPPPPPRLGGMATPLGVYLTDGNVSGGAGTAGLILTGCVMALISVGAQAAGVFVSHASFFAHLNLWTAHISSPVLRVWVTQMAQTVVPMLATLALVFGALRLLPLSGIHAAEHQTVHCIEKCLPLTVETIRTMPRVHPRCGTNLVAGLLLFQCVFLTVCTLFTAMGYGLASASSVAALAAAPVALVYWRRVGGWVQHVFATRPATDGQIQGAIRAAHEVLSRRIDRERHVGTTPARFGWRNASMMGQVLIGYGLVLGALAALSYAVPAARAFISVGL